jgi:bacterioferritin
MAKAKKAKPKKAKVTKAKAKTKAKGKAKPKSKAKSRRGGTKPMVVAKSAGVQQGLVKILNDDRAFELAAVMQYMGHHYEAQGLAAPEIIAHFKAASIDEMKHCEELAERIVYLGGVPTLLPMRGIRRGGDLRKMLGDDLEVEQEAIRRYKEHIKTAEAAGDTTTRRILEAILQDEEEHADLWQTLLA